ncbi:MAG: response regulator [Desulfobacteraceae bacterium]|jgi:CheY-like chemotaxis protein
MAHASEKKVLVVDDEPDVRNFLAACIEDAGFQVKTAVDGADALEKLQADPPDLMTLDMVMPRVSGINLMRQIRGMDAFARLPVIVITAHAHDEMGSDDIKDFNAFASGMRPRYTMEKPITPEKLVKAISDILEVDDAQVPTADGEKDRMDVIKMIGKTDPDTLKKIQSLLVK